MSVQLSVVELTAIGLGRSMLDVHCERLTHSIRR